MTQHTRFRRSPQIHRYCRQNTLIIISRFCNPGEPKPIPGQPCARPASIAAIASDQPAFTQPRSDRQDGHSWLKSSAGQARGEAHVWRKTSSNREQRVNSCVQSKSGFLVRYRLRGDSRSRQARQSSTDRTVYGRIAHCSRTPWPS